MDEIAIAPVKLDQVDLLNAALSQLALELGDSYFSDPTTLAKATCGPEAHFLGLLALRNNKLMAAALAAPVFSTSLGGAGIFVSDLWVAENARGLGLGRRLLSATLQEGIRRDMGSFLKLTVYPDNSGARAVYGRLGFVASDDEINMVLKGVALGALREGI